MQWSWGAVGLSLFWFLSGTAAAEPPCKPSAARLVSVQGLVEVQRSGSHAWTPAPLGENLCRADVVRTAASSRAAILLSDHTVIRLDENTALTLADEGGAASLLDLLRGAIHLMSRVPRSLDVRTPFLNAAVKGTEFGVRAGASAADVDVYEGLVVAQNARGTLTLQQGEGVTGTATEPPRARAALTLRQGTQWAVHYPPLIEWRVDQFVGTRDAALLGNSLNAYRSGDVAGALRQIESANLVDPAAMRYRASLALTLGARGRAAEDIAAAERLSPASGDTLALRALLALAAGDVSVARDVSGQALRDNTSVAARVVASYVEQAQGRHAAAATQIAAALQRDPDNPVLHARVAELALIAGDPARALQHGEKAVALGPHLARAHIMLGFAALANLDRRDALTAFERALERDSADPLARLGLGLARINRGELAAGRQELEIAAQLDPTNALLRSYLGKAYYDERRERHAGEQYALAQALDAADPTAWFYAAVLAYSENRPSTALRDFERAMATNDNRAVYRSRLLLDADRAARGASLARIYQELGFDQAALVEATKSLDADPTNASGHRFLSDSYAGLPRNDFARASELLQAQMLQSININPVQPQQSEVGFNLFGAAGPATTGYSEFNPLFQRDHWRLDLSGVAGSNDARGAEAVLSGIENNLSYSAGHFYYNTDGFRENADFRHEISNAFVQWAVSPVLDVQVEAQKRESENGDTRMRFYLDRYSPDARRRIESERARIGVRVAPAVGHQILLSGIAGERQDVSGETQSGVRIDQRSDADSWIGEAQYLWRADKLSAIGGGGYYDGKISSASDLDFTGLFGVPCPPFLPSCASTADTDTRHRNAYLYGYWRTLPSLVLTLGASHDRFEELPVERRETNPKLGVQWEATDDTTVRVAAFDTIKRSLPAGQTLEPTQIAGFNQIFDDVNGTRARRVGVAVDQKWGARWLAGLEGSRRELDVPRIDSTSGAAIDEPRDEWAHRAYLYWHRERVALSGEYFYDRFERGIPGFVDAFPVELKTHQWPLGAKYFHPSGWFAGWRTRYVQQSVTFAVSTAGDTQSDRESFWLSDAQLGYRFAARRGVVSLDVRNVFDREFRYHEIEFLGTEPSDPLLLPDRTVYLRGTFSFQ